MLHDHFISHSTLVLLASRTSAFNPSLATWTSTTPRMPFFQLSSNITASAAPSLSTLLLSTSTSSILLFTPANSASKLFNVPSFCQLAINQAFFPYVSNSPKFVLRLDKYVAETYAFSRVSFHCASNSGFRSSECGDVLFGGSKASSSYRERSIPESTSLGSSFSNLACSADMRGEKEGE
jgi:hypothetical protein